MEPDFDIEPRCECGECQHCIRNYEWDIDLNEDEAIRIAEYNYECRCFGEPEKQKTWR